MENNLKKYFLQAKYEPEAGLAAHIWQGVLKYEERQSKIRFFVFSFVSVLSLIGSISALFLLAGDFARSGFFQYISLLLGSGGTIATYWKEFSLTIADSIPVMSLTLSLALIFIFIASFRFTLKYFIRNKLAAAF